MSVYNQESTVYDLKRFSNPGGRHIDEIEKLLLTRYAKGPQVLEIGTATGRFIGFAETNSLDYTGLDISSRMLLLTKQNGRKLIQGDGETIPLKASIFDMVLCLHTFHFIPDPLVCLRECHRVLKPGAPLVLIFEMDTWLRRLVIKTGLFDSNQYYYTSEEVAKMLQVCGFKVLGHGPVLRFPLEAYRKLPLTWLLSRFDSLKGFPTSLATLGFAVADAKKDLGVLESVVVNRVLRTAALVRPLSSTSHQLGPVRDYWAI